VAGNIGGAQFQFQVGCRKEDRLLERSSDDFWISASMKPDLTIPIPRAIQLPLYALFRYATTTIVRQPGSTKPTVSRCHVQFKACTMGYTLTAEGLAHFDLHVSVFTQYGIVARFKTRIHSKIDRCILIDHFLLTAASAGST
jgi:hypothetical protein